MTKRKTATEKLLSATAPTTGLCPRCLTNKLHPDEVRNSSSRYARTKICNECGNEEAMFDAGYVRGKEAIQRHQRMIELAIEQKKVQK